MEEIGPKVVALRSKLGMSQKDLADAAGIPQATVSRIERGAIEQPRAEVLRKLAEALHVTLDYLAGRTSVMSGSDVVRSDPRAEMLFRGYGKMSEEEREELFAYFRFLDGKREQKARDRRDKG